MPKKVDLQPMPKRRVSIEGVRSSPQEHNIHVVVFEEQIMEGQPTEVPIGERFLTFSSKANPESMLDDIRGAAVDIQKLAQDAGVLRGRLNELLAASPGPGPTP